MPARRIDPRRAKLHRSYDLKELAERLGVHRQTVREWLNNGLPKVDDTRPFLIAGSDFQAWWAQRSKAKKRPLQPGEFYCLSCRMPKRPAMGMVDYAPTNTSTANLKALCETCEKMMHRRCRLDAIATNMPDLDVSRTQAPLSINGRADPCLNTNSIKGA